MIKKKKNPKKRINKFKIPDWTTEKSLWLQGFKLVVGVDEVGRGAWAGPVVAGAVIFAEGTEIVGVRDSKQMNEYDRECLAMEIKSRAFLYAIGEASSEEVDEKGILVATKLAMERSLNRLGFKPDFLLIDALRLVWQGVACQPIIKGDQKSISIASGSIVAKVYRDELMKKYDKKYRNYCFAEHKGYGTKKHQEMIEKYGLCDIHRSSFKCFRKKSKGLFDAK